MMILPHQETSRLANPILHHQRNSQIIMYLLITAYFLIKGK